jgi:hypothetical protein
MRGEPPIDWFVPVFVLTTVFTMSAGPAQTWFAYRYADPSIRRHGRWFWLYLLLTTLAYTEVKNVIARTAHVKEAMRERTWKVTPRAVRPATGTPGRERVPDAESAVA